MYSTFLVYSFILSYMIGQILNDDLETYPLLDLIQTDTQLAHYNHQDLLVIRQIKRCRFHQIKTGLSEHLTMG